MKKQSFSWFVLLAVSLLSVSGCVAPPGSVKKLVPIDSAVLAAAQSSAADASDQMFENQDRLRLQIERNMVVNAQGLSLMEDDPLAKKTISISVQDAHAGQLLWVLASEFGISLSVDPAVLEMSQVANLHLQKVTGRQALDQILSVFDIYATLTPGRILAVSLMEERVFDVENLIGKTSIDVSAGGDVFGSGGKNASSLKDTLNMTGDFGDKTDASEALVKSIDAILAEVAVTGKDAVKDKARFTLDRGSSALFVRARPSRIRSIDALIERGKTFRKRQVQIDAQLIDVQLNDSSQFGIDWTLLSSHLIGRLGNDAATIGSASQSLAGSGSLNSRLISIPAQSIGTLGQTGAGIGFRNNTFSATINALKTFGTVKVLSNPTVRVRNGIPAYLSVGNNIRYIQKITSNTSSTGSGSTTSLDVITDSIFSGVVVGVSALVKADGFVELFVRPSQTQVQEGSLERINVGSGNVVTLPVINSKSITTTLNIRNGDTVIIGGLIDQQYGTTESGVPGLSDMKGLGALFNSDSRRQTTRELVVVLRVKVI